MADFARYGTIKNIRFPLIKATSDDFAGATDYAFATGDIRVSLDGATGVAPSGTPSEIGMGNAMYIQLALTATETANARVDVQLVDQGTKTVKDQMVSVETYGHPDSEHPDLAIPVPDADTAQAGAAGTITLATGASATDDYYNGQAVYIVAGTGAGQIRQIVDYTGSTRVADIDPNWATNPDSTSKYALIPMPPAPNSATNAAGVDVVAWNGTAVATPDTAGHPKVTVKTGTGAGEVNITSGVPQANVVQWATSGVASPDTAGHPKVTLKSGTGAGEINITSGVPQANVVQWATSSVTSPNTAGTPVVDVERINGTNIVGTGATGDKFTVT